MSKLTPKGYKRILGIDPGTARVGWGVVDKNHSENNGIAYGCIETPKEHDHAKRLQQIYEELKEIIKEFQPDHAVMERLFFTNNITTAMGVSEARGVIMLALTENNIPFSEQTPRQLKTSITGNGNADKKQVQFMVKQMLGLEEIPKPDDAADGLALALSYQELDLS